MVNLLNPSFLGQPNDSSFWESNQADTHYSLGVELVSEAGGTTTPIITRVTLKLHDKKLPGIIL
jgi:hypothetical protein